MNAIEEYVRRETGAYIVRILPDGIIEYKAASGAGIPSQLDVWKFYGYADKIAVKCLIIAANKMRDFASAFYSLCKKPNEERDAALVAYDEARKEAALWNGMR